MSGVTMGRRALGRSGIRVSEIALGTSMWSTPEECARILEVFAARGGDLIDVAPTFTDGEAERIAGALLAGRRDRFVIGTKFGLRDSALGLERGADRRMLARSLEASLSRLRTDRVDVLWLHAPDPRTPIEETVRALDDVVRAGKALALGFSDAPAWLVARAVTIAEMHALVPFTAIQIEHGPLERSAEGELLPMARELDLAVLAWGVLSGGAVSGEPAPGSYYAQTTDDRRRARARELRKISVEIGRPVEELAIEWVRRRPGTVIPTLGPSRATDLERWLRVLDHPLDDASLARIDAATRLPLGVPHDYVKGQVST